MSSSADEALLAAFPGAPIDHDTKAYYRGLLARTLLINRCQDCGTWHFPPRPVCASCWSRRVVATEVSGRGVIHLLMVLHQGPGIDPQTPQPVATVELEEQPGLRVSTTIVNASREELHIGMPVELTWIEDGGHPSPAFQPVRR